MTAMSIIISYNNITNGTSQKVIQQYKHDENLLYIRAIGFVNYFVIISLGNKKQTEKCLKHTKRS